MVSDKRCGRRWYGHVKGKAEFCREHKRDDMVAVYGLCQEDGCITRATFGATSKKAHCVAHASEAMKRVDKVRTCAAPGCKKAPTHSAPGQAAFALQDARIGGYDETLHVQGLPSGRLRGRGDVRPAGRAGCVLRGRRGAGDGADEGSEMRGMQHAGELRTCGRGGSDLQGSQGGGHGRTCNYAACTSRRVLARYDPTVPAGAEADCSAATMRRRGWSPGGSGSARRGGGVLRWSPCSDSPMGSAPCARRTSEERAWSTSRAERCAADGCTLVRG